MKTPTSFSITASKVFIGGAVISLMLSGCGPGGLDANDTAGSVSGHSTTSSFKVYLPGSSDNVATSANQAKAGSSVNSPRGGKSKSDISDVFVQFDRIELRSDGDRTLVDSQIERTVSLLHQFDLFEGSAGITQALSDIREIRLHISDSGSYLVRSSGEICALKVPSGSQSGLKIKFSEDFSMDPNQTYALEIIFDIDHSIVLQGNGGCLLKPVLRARIHKTGTTTPDSGTTTPDSEIGWINDGPTIVEVVP